VAELADALGSGPSGLTMPVEVQVLSSALPREGLRRFDVTPCFCASRRLKHILRAVSAESSSESRATNRPTSTRNYLRIPSRHGSTKLNHGPNSDDRKGGHAITIWHWPIARNVSRQTWVFKGRKIMLSSTGDVAPNV
jgi:hypothetical protein